MRKLFLALLVILLMISIALLVISIYQEQIPEEPQVVKLIKKEPLPDAKYIIPEYPPISEEMTKEQPPVSKDIKKEKSSVSKDLKKDKLPVSKGVKKEKSSVSKDIKKEQKPVPEDIKKEQAPVPEDIKKEQVSVKEKSLKEISKLQEKCENRSKKIFHKEYKDGTVENSKGLFLYKYKNHYNKKLDKCFMVITEDGVLERYKKLLDVDENNSFGSVRINNDQENLGCYLLEKKCKSEEGWDSIVKHYMEE